MYVYETWSIKKAEHRRIDAFELWCWRRLESPLDCKEIQPVHPEGHQSWVFIGRTDIEAETPVLWPPDTAGHLKCWLIWKDPDAGKDWRWEEKETTEDEMVGCHHKLNEHEWVSSGSWRCTGKPGMLQSTGSQRVGHNWATELSMFYVLEMVGLNRTLWSLFVWTEKKKCFSNSVFQENLLSSTIWFYKFNCQCIEISFPKKQIQISWRTFEVRELISIIQM